ncbi:MAG TPA: 4Fe-4S binding protein [Aggregatilineaceae bacterium]|nr:4Fe-4S binding protein [Aggregatilineaceae bacterium]
MKVKLSGMWQDALRSMLKGPVTERYPFVRHPSPEHLRSQLHWDLTKCTGCGLCAKDCPADAIDIITIDKKAKQFVFHYSIDRCTFCGQCVESCRQGCLEMSNDEWELAALDKKAFEVYYGNPEHIQVVLAEPSEEDVPEPENA